MIIFAAGLVFAAFLFYLIFAAKTNCPNCRSVNVVGEEISEHKTGFMCFDCSYTWIDCHGFGKM